MPNPPWRRILRRALRYFLDTEHTDDGERFELISIAVVCEDGREYYAAVEGYEKFCGDSVGSVRTCCHSCHRRAIHIGSRESRFAMT